MLNMKKGLAIVLAAATALTFAPVSTLGLTGVVEAQAAATDFKDSKSDDQVTMTPATSDASAKTWDLKETNKASFGEGSVSLSADDTIFWVKIKGLISGDATKAADQTVSIEQDNTVVERIDPDHIQKSISGDVVLTGKKSTDTNPETKDVAFKANTKGVAKVTLTANKGKTDEKTLTLTLTVNGPVASNSSVSFTNTATTPETISTFDLKSDATTPSDPNAKIKVTGEGINAGDTVYAKVRNNNVVDFADTDSDSNATVLDAKGVAGIKLSAHSGATAGSYTYLDVYASKADADKADAKPLASLRINITDTFKVTTTPLARKQDGVFTFITSDDTNDVTIAITKKNATGTPTTVTGDFDFFYGDAKASNGSKISGAKFDHSICAITKTGTNYLWINPAKAENGDYTITLTQATGGSTKTTSADFTVSDSVKPSDDNNGGSTKPETPKYADNSAVFGGVITDLYATDNTSYNLVSSDAEFELNNTRYTANQLKWYLTKAPTKTPENMGLTTGAGSIAASTTGKLNVTVSNAEQFAQDINGTSSDPDPDPTDNAYIVGVYTSGADNTIVYSHPLLVKHADKGYVTKNYDAGTISTSVDAIAKADPANQISDSFLNGVKFIGVNNKYLKGKDIESLDFTKAIYNGTHFNATLAKGGDGDEVLKGSKLTAHADEVVRDGVYYETFYVPYTEKDTNGKFVAAITVKVSVSAGPVVEIKEGNFTYSLTETEKKDQSLRDKKVIDLDLTTNKTFDIAAHAVSNKDNTSYTYDPDTQNVTVDAKGVVTAAKVGTAVVTVTPTANGVKGASVYVFFRVNKNANDQISVTGKDGDKATVLTTRQYNGNRRKLNSEKALAAAQVGYVQVEVTGDENNDVKEDLTVKGAGKLSYALANDPVHGESVDAKTGQITISHDWLKNNTNPAYIFPVKVVSTETNSSALTTGYFYVVVDFADATITGLENSYNVGASYTDPGSTAWLNLGNNDVYGPQHVSSNAEITVDPIQKSAELDDSKVYDNDDISSFVPDGTAIKRAIVAGKTEHVLVSASDRAHKIGQTYKVVTITSVAGQTNYVTKIENVDTGKTIYDQSTAAVSGASITINKPTVVKVTVAHAPSAALDPKYDPAFTIGDGDHHGFNYNTEHLFVAATENPATYEITLIPSVEGTQIVKINPTDERLSSTDYSLVGTEYFNLAVKYSTADSKTPAQVKGVKLGNKKGAKVVVKFTKDTTDKNIKYYVQKKVGKKTSGKSVGSNRTILSVKRGATVKVRVKAYYYDANGVKHVGKYSKWVTKKTDKK